MDDAIQNIDNKLKRYFVIVILLVLFVWQGFTAYVLNQISLFFSNYEQHLTSTSLINILQPFIWLFMFLTLSVIYTIYKRKKFLVGNSLMFVAIIVIGTLFLGGVVAFYGYQPFIELGSTK